MHCGLSCSLCADVLCGVPCDTFVTVTHSVALCDTVCDTICDTICDCDRWCDASAIAQSGVTWMRVLCVFTQGETRMCAHTMRSSVGHVCADSTPHRVRITLRVHVAEVVVVESHLVACV